MFKELKKPKLDRWESDKQFCLHFIQGVNPLTIKKVQDMSNVHKKLRSLTAEIDGEELPMDHIMRRGKLFLADYSELDNITLHGTAVFYSPQVLLSLDKFGDLDIIAILLRTNKLTKKTHVLTKASPPNRLLFAKMHVANADAQIHEFHYHLKIHLIMEAIAIGVHNFLSDHVLGRLLAPHMKGTIFINFVARTNLINKNNSIVGNIFSVGRNGALKLLSDHLMKVFNFQESAFPKMMAARGFPKDESDGVKDYFYRSDGFKLWDIITKYVEGVVNKKYDNDLEVEKDEVLQNFAQSMSDFNEGNIRGFPENIKTKELLIESLTNILFTGSVQHQAVNAPQYQYYYVPHRPTFMTKWMPDGEEDLTWEWIKTALPTMERTKKVHSLFMLLTKQSFCTLSSLDVFKDEYPAIQQQLTRDLNKLSSEIKSRDGDYKHLDPANVACSVDI